MYLTDAPFGGDGYLVAVEGSWSESSLTWVNQPSHDLNEYDHIRWPVGTTGWQSWQATELVTEWVRGRRPNHGLAITSRGLATPPSTFHSREGSSVLAPRLCVEWEPYVNVLDLDNVGWVSGRNFTSSAFSDWFSELSGLGYMIVDIEVDEIDGTQRVGGVWQRNTDNRGWLQTRNMTLSVFESLQQTRAEAGYRMIDQEVYVLGTSTFYAGIWMENRENLQWANYYNVTSSEFSTLFSHYAGLGYMPIDVDAYVIDGQLRYAAIWVENIEGLAWQLWRDMSSQAFADKFAELFDNFRMIDTESYRFGGQQLFAGIWVENRNGRAWAQYRNLTSKGFHERWSELRDAGYRLINYEVYPWSTGYRYAGVWRQNGNRLNWELKDEIDALVQQFFDDGDLPGMSVAIAQNGQFRYLRGLGHADVANSVATDSRTIYRLASVSKAVGGALGVRLSQQGLLDLSAGSGTYIAQLPAAHSHSVLQTLTQRSGIGHYSAHPSIVGAYATALDAAEQLWDTPLVNAPGAQCTYSTHAFTFAGASMEAAANAPISTIIDSVLRNPYNLTSLRAEDRSIPHPKRSLLYAQSGGTNQEVSADDLSWKVLGGGLESSAFDLARFGMRLTDGTILSPASLAQLWTAPDGSCNYGPGWSLGTHLGSQVVAHRGTQNGARSYIRVYPDENIVIAILTNRRTGHDPRPLGIDIGAVMLNAAAASTAGISSLDVSQAEIEEPDAEALPDEFVVWPVSNPTLDPTPEDLQELESDAEAFFSGNYLPLVMR